MTNVWQAAAGPNFARLARRLWPMLAGIVVGALAGTGLLTGSHAGQAAIVLGLLLMLYAGLGLTRVRFSISARKAVAELMANWLIAAVHSTARRQWSSVFLIAR